MAKVTLTAHPQRRAVRSGEGGSLFVALSLRATGGAAEKDRPPIVSVLALDISGSMAGAPLEMLLGSVEQLCELAQPTDRLGMVVFADSASLVAPLTAMDPIGKRVLVGRARRLVAQGGTNLEDALKIGGGVLGQCRDAARPSILLLSDGQPNRGASTPEALAAAVASLRPRITVSTLGYGIKHDEDVLVAIADAGAGRFAFIPDPASCRRELASALGSQGDVIAGEVELLLSPAPGIELKRIVGDPPTRFTRDGLLLALSDMEDQALRIVTLELTYQKPLDLSGHLLDVRVSFRDAESSTLERNDAVVSVDVSSAGSADDPEASALILLTRAEEARKRARSLADKGGFEGAGATIRAMLSEIVASPAYVPGDGSLLSEAYEQLLDEAVAFERNPSTETYSVFRKQTIMQKLDGDGARSVAPLRGTTSRRFAQVTSGPSKIAHLVVVRGLEPGKTYPVREACAIGRTAGADVVVHSSNVSRRHAEIYRLDAEHWVCDLGSTNATEVNGKKLSTTPHKLVDGDLIRVGDVELRYVLGAPS